jgi:hypothetical protein
MRRSGSSSGVSSETPMASTAALLIASVSSSQTNPDLSKSRWPSATSKSSGAFGLRRCVQAAKPSVCLSGCHRVAKLDYLLMDMIAGRAFECLYAKVGRAGCDAGQRSSCLACGAKWLQDGHGMLALGSGGSTTLSVAGRMPLQDRRWSHHAASQYRHAVLFCSPSQRN